jgi:hypothetical protein
MNEKLHLENMFILSEYNFHSCYYVLPKYVLEISKPLYSSGFSFVNPVHAVFYLKKPSSVGIFP